MEEISARNAWIAAVAKAARPLPGWVAVAITVALFAHTLVAAPSVTRLLLLGGVHSLIFARSMSSLAYYLPLYLIPLLLMRFYERRPLPPFGVAWLGFGLGFGAFGFLLALGLAGLLGVLIFVGAQPLTPVLVLNLLAAAAIIAFRSFAEEFLFRGWLQPLLVYRWGPWPGVVVTSILFAAVHVARNFHLLGMINVALAGAFFGLLALRTGSLAAALAAHWVWNTLEQCVFGLSPNNPGLDRLGSVLDIDLAGPVLFSGGIDAMNGSLATAVALLLCIFLLARWQRFGALLGRGTARFF